MTTDCQTAIFLLPILIAGCAVRGDTDLLEARLRHQEDRLFEMQHALEDALAETEALRRENNLLHAEAASGTGSAMLPEQAGALVRAEEIRISTWTSGGIETDGHPGDDALLAVISPVDAQGEAVKLAGTLRLRLTDPDADSGSQVIGEWTFSPQETRQYWHRGMMAEGFQFRLLWQTVPRSSRLLLEAVLQTADGREFRTREFIRVTPPAHAIAEPIDLNGEKGNGLQPVQQTSAAEPGNAGLFPIEGDQGEQRPREPAPRTRGEPNPFITQEPGDLKPADSSPRLRTSDNWTDATIPRLR